MIWPEAEDRSPHNGRRGEVEGGQGEEEEEEEFHLRRQKERLITFKLNAPLTVIVS